MTRSPDCKPWCDNHLTKFENSCNTMIVIYDDGRQAEAPPTPGTMAALFRAGLPKAISWVAFVASQDEEDEKPIMDLQFFEAGDGAEQISNLHVDLDGLRTLHSSLADILREFS
ncbi:hypothetical protein [Arthrobacter sp. zg-Y179]|uniref:hypothetical protein n=1 Tax=Arthrobacter sp. zg-Y179 TaxID=2894188 RepID=UPI001E2CF487|nr:hypothetical protein [Arthrobacter sp. zg-Y179]MCC9173242.1 hypothetical protein [Arthrobacter sp. zg-Y179]